MLDVTATATPGADPLTVVPAPVSVSPTAGVSYTIDPTTTIHTDVAAAGEYLAETLRPATGYPLPVTASAAEGDGIALVLTSAEAGLGAEGYQLDVTATGVTVRAQTPAGLFYGTQTLLQLLPVQDGPWTVPGGRIVDHPRYAYRGAMLDVARHFFPVETVKRYLDEISQYKINVLHLHLTDDQGWRIAVDAYPQLTTVGGSTQVEGGPGGYYSKAQYRDIVAHAATRHITIVPEIDMPGHVNAALASYPELNGDDTAPALYTGIDVGFSSLSVAKEHTYTFVRQVLDEVAELTPGPYLHIGGDEAHSTPAADYRTFLNRVQPAVHKTVIGWHQIGQSDHVPGRVVQFWGIETTDEDLAAAVGKGDRILLSPANKTYLDMKYTEESPLGQDWAGLVEVRTSYDWDPDSYLTDVPVTAILGVEAPLWTETIRTPADIEYMTFPRLPALAEVAWSPQAARDWDNFKVRLAAQGPRWEARGISFYRSPQIPWPDGVTGPPAG